MPDVLPVSGRLKFLSAPTLLLALGLGLPALPSVDAAQPSGGAPGAGGPSKAGRSKGGSSALWSPKVPAAGQAAMNWPGLNLVDQLDCLSSNAAAAPAWHPVIAPGMQAVPPSNARTDCILSEGWTFIPVGIESNQPGKPRAASIPERWPDERDHVAGWYIRKVPLTPRDGERLIARFEQVALFCVLYVNGIECGRHLGAYTPFDFDLTPAARTGDNLLAIYVHDASAALGGKGVAYNQVSSWRPQSPTPLSGGPWGALRLERRPAAHVADVFVKTSTRRHELTLECELVHAGPQSQSVKLDFALLNWPDGAPVPLTIPTQKAALSPGKTAKITGLIFPGQRAMNGKR